ncbi:NTP transferase domain-containing protein [Schleiferilactobacillus harbinensis]|jgi:UTP--glucose-1-phosphate uridylyltransferase|uniref:UTP--glucose-1-phosphate uridylyltransferase n=1 Tax=Schleiferilactobacillus harbinensis TaxID=304207 RepID=UPI001AAEA940|nr:sugar phosphate nucleotidyltransferase [Schleiferilactobacillus harbinensis]MBO3091380.1 NTP transferase domain-containing protein [Schleiferilactobacillus harbinensis]
MVKAVIAAGGLGGSLMPLTKAVAKEIMPLGGRPVIDYIVRELQANGITEILLVANKSKQAIEDYFDSAPELEHLLRAKGDTAQLADIAASTAVNLHFIRQQAADGIGSALALAEDFIDGEDFCFVLSDDVLPLPTTLLQQLWQAHTASGQQMLATVPIAAKQSEQYGIVEWADKAAGQIKRIAEKPTPATAPSQDAVFGRYVFSAAIFDQLAQYPADQQQFAQALNALAAEGNLTGLPYGGPRENIDGRLSLLEANIDLALTDPDTAAPLRAYLRRLVSD